MILLFLLSRAAFPANSKTSAAKYKIKTSIAIGRELKHRSIRFVGIKGKYELDFVF
jgi:hypothetical protein